MKKKKNEPVCLVAIDAGRKLEIPVFFVGNKLENLLFFYLEIFLVWLYGGVVRVTPVTWVELSVLIAFPDVLINSPRLSWCKKPRDDLKRYRIGHR